MRTWQGFIVLATLTLASRGVRANPPPSIGEVCGLNATYVAGGDCVCPRGQYPARTPRNIAICQAVPPPSTGCVKPIANRTMLRLTDDKPFRKEYATRCSIASSPKVDVTFEADFSFVGPRNPPDRLKASLCVLANRAETCLPEVDTGHAIVVGDKPHHMVLKGSFVRPRSESIDAFVKFNIVWSDAKVSNAKLTMTSNWIPEFTQRDLLGSWHTPNLETVNLFWANNTMMSRSGAATCRGSYTFTPSPSTNSAAASGTCTGQWYMNFYWATDHWEAAGNGNLVFTQR